MAESLSLQQAQTLARAKHPEPPRTIQDALALVLSQAQAARQALQNQAYLPAQARLEEVLVSTLLALSAFDVQAESAFWRVLDRYAKQQKMHQRMVLYPERVELWVGNQQKGGWPLFSEADYQNCLQMAEQLGCELEERTQAMDQLNLFPTEPAPPPPLTSGGKQRLGAGG